MEDFGDYASCYGWVVFGQMRAHLMNRVTVGQQVFRNVAEQLIEMGEVESLMNEYENANGVGCEFDGEFELH